jgi:hypothetical protein
LLAEPGESVIREEDFEALRLSLLLDTHFWIWWLTLEHR